MWELFDEQMKVSWFDDGRRRVICYSEPTGHSVSFLSVGDVAKSGIERLTRNEVVALLRLIYIF